MLQCKVPAPVLMLIGGLLLPCYIGVTTGQKNDRTAAVRELYRGSIAQRQGDLGQALTHYTNAVSLDGKLAEAYNNLGTVYFQQGQYGKAQEAYTTALKLSRDFAQAHCNMGTVLLRRAYTERQKSLYRLAEGHLRKAIELAAIPEAYNTLGILHVRQGKFHQGSEYFEKARQLRPHYVDAFINMSYVMSHTGRIDTAFALLEEALNLDPKSAEARLSLGVLHLMQGDLSQAKLELEKTTAENPQMTPSFVQLAILHLHEGATERAVEVAQKAVELDDASAEAHNVLGVSWYQLGLDDEVAVGAQAREAPDPSRLPGTPNREGSSNSSSAFEEALKELNEATRLDPLMPGPYKYRGRILARKGRFGEAVKAYGRYLDLHPDSDDAEQIRRQISALKEREKQKS